MTFRVFGYCFVNVFSSCGFGLHFFRVSLVLKWCRASLLWACLAWASLLWWRFFGLVLPGIRWACGSYFGAGFFRLSRIRFHFFRVSLACGLTAFTSLGSSFGWASVGLHVCSLYMYWLRVFGFGIRTLLLLGFWGLGWRVQGFSGLGLGLHFFSLLDFFGFGLRTSLLS